MSDSGALLRYVQRPNAVDLVEGEKALKERGRYSELVALYGQHGRHEAALDVLQALSQGPDKLPVGPQGRGWGCTGILETRWGLYSEGAQWFKGCMHGERGVDAVWLGRLHAWYQHHGRGSAEGVLC